VGTVDSFQGQERGISAITLTRSNPQGEISRDWLPVWHPPHERGDDPRTAQAAAGGRFVHAVQASVFWGVVGLCEGGGGYRTAQEMGK
jgi:hypothetical protein